MKKLVVGILLLMGIMVPGNAFALLGLASIEGAVGGFWASPSGTFQYKAGTNGDVEGLLGFDEETLGVARLRMELPLILPNIYLMATPMEFEGDLKGNFTFKNQTFTATDNASLTLDQYDIALFYGIPLLGLVSLDRLAIDFGINVRIVSLDAKISSSTPGIASQSESMDVPVPMAFLAARLKLLAGFSLEGEIRALDVDYARVISAIGRVKYDTFGPFFVAAGYRYEEVAVDEDDVDMDVEIAGPFMELGVSF